MTAANKAIAQAIQCAGNNQHKHIGGCCAQNVGEKSYEQAKEQHVAASHPVDQAAAEHAGNCNGNTTNGKNKGVMLLSAQILRMLTEAVLRISVSLAIKNTRKKHRVSVIIFARLSSGTPIDFSFIFHLNLKGSSFVFEMSACNR